MRGDRDGWEDRVEDDTRGGGARWRTEGGDAGGDRARREAAARGDTEGIGGGERARIGATVSPCVGFVSLQAWSNGEGRIRAGVSN